MFAINFWYNENFYIKKKKKKWEDERKKEGKGQKGRHKAADWSVNAIYWKIFESLSCLWNKA